MNVIQSPEVKFSEWVPWSERSRLRQPDGPWLGLYLWARFDLGPPASTAPYPSLPEQVIYVGETKHLDLRPLTGEHHRLAHYRDTFRDDPALKYLVSVCRVKKFEGGYHTPAAIEVYPTLRVYTQYVEAKLYWEYTQRWCRPPALHYKKTRKGDNRV